MEFGESSDALTAEKETELTALQAELKSNELKLQALNLAQANDDAANKVDGGESKELNKVIERADFSEFVLNQYKDRNQTGAILELQQKNKLAVDQVPWEMLGPKGRYAEFADTSLSTSIELPTNSMPFLSYVFNEGGAMWLGVTMTDSQGLDFVVPQISSGSGFSVAAKHADVTSVAATISTTKGQATRLTASYNVAVEDQARLPEMTDAIQRHLRMSLNHEIDKIVFTENKQETMTSAGFGATTGGLTAPTKPGSGNFANNIKALPDLDKYANDYSQIRLLVGYDLAKLMRIEVNSNGLSIWQVAKDMGYMCRATEHVPATASNLVQGFYSRTMGIERAAVWNFFGSPTLLLDNITNFTKGGFRIGLMVLANFARVRDANFGRWGGNNS